MARPDIGIIGGTGKEGTGLALRFARAGFGVTVGSRQAARAREVVDALRADHPELELDGADNAAVIAGHDVNLLTVPYEHAAALLREHRDAFRPGSLLVDVTVPVRFSGGAVRYVEPEAGSAAEELRAALHPDVGLAAALKTLPAFLLGKLDRPLDCDVFVAGDTPASRERAIAILERLEGLRPVDVGDLEACRALERMTVLLIGVNRRYKIHDGRFRILGLD